MTNLPAPALPASTAFLPTPARKAMATARDFEAQFLKSMLEQAFATVDGEGPLGSSGPGAEAWRGMLIDEHAKALSARGGIGIAPAVYRDLMRQAGGQLDARI